MPGRSVYLETFGCQMNELDSELVTGALRALGYRFVADAAQASVVLYNTCSVREHAEQKVWSRLGEMAVRKKRDPALVVGVLGCMAERDGVDLIRRMPQVDVLCGPGELDKLPGLLDNAVRTRESLAADDPDVLYAAAKSAQQVALQGNASRRSATLAAAEDTLELLDLSRSVSPVDAGEPARRASAYVRITRGCNKFCTYCVVPFTRGAEVHRPPDHIIDECKRLADAGVLEVTLLGQTVNHYRFEHGAAVTVAGVTQPQKGRSYAGGHRRDPFAGASVTTFADLLRRIHDEAPAIRRLRFVTSYPRDFGDDVLEVMRDHPRICRYLHVPAQSGSDRMLKMMNRGYTASEYLEFIDRARAFLHQPERGRPLSISGDFIVGFPTETDDDFEQTVALLERARYKNAFIFKYSPRPGTVAFDKLADDVPDEAKRHRNNHLLAVQTRITGELLREELGRTHEVFVEGLSIKEVKKARRQQQGGPARGSAVSGGVSLTIAGKRVGAGHAQAAHAGAAGEAGTDGACSAHGSHVHVADTLEPDEHQPDQARALRAARAEGRPTLQLSGRTDTDLIVLFDAPTDGAEDLVGRIVPVRITGATTMSLLGARAAATH
jgi:tRNA-2-methylthio-N6-dimethylallyladenosine synthase